MEDNINVTETRNPVIHYSIQLVALALLLVCCFMIIQNFITPIIWGSVLAITLYPLHKSLTSRLNGRGAWSAILITVLLFALIMMPAIWLLLATVGEFKELVTMYKAGNLYISPPTAEVKAWPVVGPKLYDLWLSASADLSALVQEHADQIKPVLVKVLDLFTSTSMGILIFMVSIIISGIMLGYADSAGNFARALLIQIAGEQGHAMSKSAELTVRNVAKSILGVSLIQSMLAGFGFVLAGIPFAGLWILVCLILAIVQIGILPVSIGIIVYIWSTADTFTAILLTIWMLFVGVIDNILKPIMLGKGAPAPMIIVFLGSIGGFMVQGIIGLFTGAIILTLGYNMIMGWLDNNSQKGVDLSDKNSVSPE